MKYDVTITYNRASDNKQLVTHYILEASSDLSARRLARTRFRNDWRRRNSTILKVSSEPLFAPKPRAAAAPVPVSAYPIGVQQRTFDGRRFTIVSEFGTSRRRPMFVIENAEGALRIVSKHEIDNLLSPPTTVEYWAIYPNGNAYTNSQPVRSSSFDLNDITQIKITKQGGKVIDKQIL